MAEKDSPVEKNAPAPTETAPAVDPVALELGTNAHGVDLNDPALKGGTDNPEAQAANEARMQAAVGTDRPVVEQIQDTQPESVPTPAPEEPPADTKPDKK